MDQVFEHRLRLLLFWCVTPLLAIVTAFGLTARNLKLSEYSQSKQRQDAVKLERWAQKHCGEDYLRYRQVAAMYDLSGNAYAFENEKTLDMKATAENALRSEHLWFWPTTPEGVPLPLGTEATPEKNMLRLDECGYGPNLGGIIRKPEWQTYLPEFYPVDLPTSEWTDYRSNFQFGYPLYPICPTDEEPEAYRQRIQAAAFDQSLLVPIRHFFVAEQRQPATMSEAMSRFHLSPITGRLAQIQLAGPVNIYRHPTRPVYAVKRLLDGKGWFERYELHDSGTWSSFEWNGSYSGEDWKQKRQEFDDQFTLWWDGTEASLKLDSVPPPVMPD